MGCRAREAINGWFRDLVTSAINPVFGLVGRSLLATPQLDRMPRVQQMWTGSMIIANTSFVLLVVVGGLILMGYETLQTSTTIKEIAPRLVVGFVLANLSLVLVGKAIELANGLSAALLAPGVDPAAAANTLREAVSTTVLDASMFVILLALGAVILGLILAVIFIVRVMVTILLISAAPLALACYALPQTDGVARLWGRAFAGVLAIQILQALVFIAAARVFFSAHVATYFTFRRPSGYVDLLIVLCLLYVLVRIPAWVARMVWRGGLRSSPIARIARTVAAIVIFRHLLRRPAPARPARAPRPRPVRSATRGGDAAILPSAIGRNAPHVTWLPRNRIHRAVVKPFRRPAVKGGEGAATPDNIITRAPRVSWPPAQRRYPPTKSGRPTNRGSAADVVG
ncbi:MAG: hypothetical protein GEV03_23660 [Streptosporangiales bacterium]|nr:hypothetical protein [Streptosporangiales bacterium]